MIFVTAASCVQHSASAKGKIGFFCTLELSGKRRRTKEGEKLARGREENKKSWQRTCHSGAFCKNNSP